MSRLAPRPTRHIFRWPLLLGVATLAGLVLGLTGDGMPDLLAWLLVGLAPLVILVALLRRERPSH